jgi:hypothetical protein
LADALSEHDRIDIALHCVLGTPLVIYELDEVCRELGLGCAPLSGLDGVPERAGLYSLAVPDGEAIGQLGLEELEPEAPLASRVLYLGKSETSISDRLIDTHFAAGKSGHSTVRRTFGALLGLSAIPRPSRITAPTRKQLMTMTANFAFNDVEERRLTAWMLSNIEVRAYATRTVALGKLERDVGARLKPPLDQEREPFWAPNPWRVPVATAREGIRLELRRQLGIAR